MSKWLITGGCGFIGIRLVKNILSIHPNASIHIVDNQTVGTLADLLDSIGDQVTQIEPSPNEMEFNSHKGVYFYNCEANDKHVLDTIVPNVDTIVHLAANPGVQQSVQDPRLDFNQNVVVTFDLLDAIRRSSLEDTNTATNNNKHFVFASSGAPLGSVKTLPINEEVAPHPVSPYGASKLSGEGYCSAFSAAYGFQSTILRFGNVYGPGSKHKNSVVAKFIKRALNNEPISVYGDGNQTRDYIFVDDLVDSILKADKTTYSSEIFQIATNQETSINELVVMLQSVFKRFGTDVEVINVEPLPVGDVPRNFSDVSKAKAMLGWSATTALDEGLQQTIEYFMELQNNEFR